VQKCEDNSDEAQPKILAQETILTVQNSTSDDVDNLEKVVCFFNFKA
jgi:hypothetical protein